jgi:hypothetical protein
MIHVNAATKYLTTFIATTYNAKQTVINAKKM